MLLSAWQRSEEHTSELQSPCNLVCRLLLEKKKKLLQLLSQAPGRPLCAEERDFGATAALWDLARQLDLLRTIDAQAPKRKQGPSVGEYLLLATLNRALAPPANANSPPGIGIPSWSGCFRCPGPLCAVSASGITCTLWTLPSWRGSKKISRSDWWKNGEWVWKRCFTTPPTSTRSFPRRTPRSWRSGDTPRANAPIYASWAWPCWSPGIFIFLSSPRSTRATRTTRSPSAGFWTIWSLATRCSAGNARTLPWFSIRETTRRKIFRNWTTLPTILLALWCPPSTKIYWTFLCRSFMPWTIPLSPRYERIAPRRKSLGGNARSSSPAAAPCSGGRSAASGSI